MQIDNPWAGLLFIIFPVVCFLKKFIKRGTIIVPTVEPMKMVNTKFRYKYCDWAFGLRMLELLFLVLSAMKIKTEAGDVSSIFSFVVLVILVLEIFLRNTFWRMLP